MKPGSFIAIIVFSIVALPHFLRVIYRRDETSPARRSLTTVEYERLASLSKALLEGEGWAHAHPPPFSTEAS
jgi:hypothetical protein